LIAKLYRIDKLEFTGYLGFGRSEEPLDSLSAGVAAPLAEADPVVRLDGGAVTVQRAAAGATTLKVSRAFDYADTGDASLVVTGSGLGDTIVLGTGNVTVRESAGTNLIFVRDAATAGNNIVTGGTGGDRVMTGKGQDTLTGRAGDDLLAGGAGNDTLDGGDGDDQLDGGAGSDVLRGGAGSDTLDGGSSDDALDGGAGMDSLFGRGGNDTYVVDDSADIVREDFAAGIDDGGVDSVEAFASFILGAFVENLRLMGAASLSGTGNALANALTGNAGANELDGAAGEDVLNGGAGDDTLKGGAGKDVLDGAAGIDTADYSDKTLAVVVALAGSADAVVKVNGANEDTIRNIERVTGGSGSDSLTGDSLANLLNGGDGNDVLKGGAGKDVLDGAAGIDTADYSDKTLAVAVTLAAAAGAAVKVGGVTEDTLRNIENFIGGAGSDSLAGDALANSLNGGGGNDTLKGGAGADRLNGAAGIDTADYSDKTLAVAVTLAGATDVAVTVNGVSEDTLRNIENLIGGSGSDRLTGDSLANALNGGGGNDTLKGGGGLDVLTGGAGADTFILDQPLVAGNITTIADFTPGLDIIGLGRTVFAAAGAVGPLTPAAFFIGALAHDADDRIMYNPANGALKFDADGSGGAATARTIAMLGSNLSLTASDFRVV